MIFSNESIAKIDWSLERSLSTTSISFRSWSFRSNGGGNAELLARIFGDGPSEIVTKLYEVAIEKPATMVLKNVNGSYNGTYQFTLVASHTNISEVVVFIAGTFHLKVRNLLESNIFQRILYFYFFKVALSLIYEKIV